eukprot:TRINITY_DN11260_c0_g1_i3.p1 TRINITY_DN11260_c0_g1~~TRINITY_DN11260_c0_g1_i3.p1  ORF type:complete len:767 (-),score=62.89 TRINITY_DN11260_c0_g1_i3:86-2386(-)
MRPLSFPVLWFLTFVGAQSARREEGETASADNTDHSVCEKAALAKVPKVGVPNLQAYRKQTAASTQESFKQILLDGEEVKYAWKHVKSYFFLTDRRVVHVKYAMAIYPLYSTIGYHQILRFSVTTAGGSGWNSEYNAFISFWVSRAKFGWPVSGSDGDLFEVNKFLADMLIRESVSLSAPSNLKPDMSAQGTPSHSSGDMVRVGPDLIEGELKTKEADVGPVLLEDEKVLFAYRGRVGMLLFTDKRIVIRVQKSSSKKTSSGYVSFSYKHVSRFAMFDQKRTATVHIFTQKQHFELLLSKAANSDAFQLYKLMSQYLLPRTHNEVQKEGSSLMSVKQTITHALPFFSASGGLYIDAKNLPSSLSSEAANPLMPDEQIVQGVQSGRDMFIVTSKRILTIDVQSNNGKQIEYKSCLPETITELAISEARNKSEGLDAEMVLTFEDGRMTKVTLNGSNDDITLVGNELMKRMLSSQPEVLADDADDDSESRDDADSADDAEILKKLRDVKALFEGEVVHSSLQILTNDHETFLVFAAQRLLFVGTDHSRLWYRSIPYHRILSFKTSLPDEKVGKLPGRVGQIDLLIGSSSVLSFVIASGSTADLARVSRMLARRILKPYEARASNINKIISAETWQSHHRPGLLRAMLGGFIDKTDDIQTELSTQPYKILLRGERVSLAYSFAQTSFGRQVLLTQWRIIVIQRNQDEALVINSVPYDSVDTFLVDPGKPADQGQFIILSLAADPLIIDTEVGVGQNVLDFAIFLAKFSF